jgi:hypothetical protein
VSLQALKDDLAQAPEGYPVTHGEAVAVARRVAALYDTCPICGGSGERTRVAECPDRERIRKQWGEGVSCCVDHREVVPCSRCGGTGMVASEAFADLWSTNGLYYYQEAAAALAACLFGKEG